MAKKVTRWKANAEDVMDFHAWRNRLQQQLDDRIEKLKIEAKVPKGKDVVLDGYYFVEE